MVAKNYTAPADNQITEEKITINPTLFNIYNFTILEVIFLNNLGT